MKTLSSSEAAEWCKSHRINLDSRQVPATTEDDECKCRFEIPSHASKHFWLCRLVESTLRPWQRCLLWITSWGIWESSENWHLYYRLRQSYGDYRLIEDAPAHLFLDYEGSDLISFLQVALSMGWDVRLFTTESYSRVFVSHDEWIEIAMRDDTELNNLVGELHKGGVKVFSHPPAS